MRKFISFILLFILLLNSFGFYPIFLIKQHKIKKDLRLLMNQTFLQNKTVILTFNLNDHTHLKWLNEKEFLYEGNLYDVVQKRIEMDGTVHYSCINDTKERRLIVQLEKEISRQVENQAKYPHSNKDLTKHLIKEYLKEKSAISFFPFTSYVAYNEQISLYASLTSEIHIPPPKSA